MSVSLSNAQWIQSFFRARLGDPYVYGGVWNPGNVKTGCDCCLVGDTLVWGPDGARRIKDLEPGHRVFSYEDTKMTVNFVTAAWFSRKQEVFKVRTRRRSVVGSANHPFLRLTSPQHTGSRPGVPSVEFVKLDELQRGDWLVQPKECRLDRAENTLPSGREVSVDEAWMLGLFVGDGSITGGQLSICVYGEFRERASRILTKTLGLSPLGRPYTIAHGPSHGLRVKCTNFCHELEDAGFHAHASEKNVPECVWGWSSDLQRAFLDGYCDADGHRPTDSRRCGVRTYSSCSRQLLEQVRFLHISLGDPVTNVTTNKRTKPIVIEGRRVSSALPLHTFGVSYKHDVGGGIASTRDSKAITNWIDAGEFTLAKVLDVTPQGVEDTYDIEVAGSHNFIANGIVVHNSGAVGSVLECLTSGPQHMSWGHVVSTESWHYNYAKNTPAPPGSVGPYGTIAVASLKDIPSDAALTINIMHGGGGEDSHMNCVLQGTIIESNGSYGTCTNGTGAYPSDASLWTDHWYLPGPLTGNSSAGGGYVNNSTLYADVSEFQTPATSAYTDAGYRVLCIRSNDGTYQDHNFAANYRFCVNAVNSGALDFFIVYYYWRTNGTGPGTHIAMVEAQGGPHPRMVSMMDVESGSGNGSVDRSAELNAEFVKLAGWLGDNRRVIGYGNTGDLNSIWPSKPQGIRLVIAGYGSNPSYPGKIAHQYTDGTGWGVSCGLPDGASPFGSCDMNSADGLSSTEFAAACGLGGSVLTPPPAPQPAPAPAASTYTVQPGDTLGAIARQFGISLPDLERANPAITNPNLIYPGETIVIPSYAILVPPPGPPAPAPLPVTEPVVAARTPPADGFMEQVQDFIVKQVAKEVAEHATEILSDIGQDVAKEIEQPIPDPPPLKDFAKEDARSRAIQTLAVGVGLSALWGAIGALGALGSPDDWFTRNSWTSVLSVMAGAAATAAGNYLSRMFKEPSHQKALPPEAKAAAVAAAKASRHKRG